MNYHNSSYSLIDSKGQRKYLNKKERNQFYKSLKGVDLEIKLFCLMLFWSGARISEVLNLRKESIDQDECMVVIESLKKRKKGVFRQVPIPPSYLKKLKSIIENRQDHYKIWTYSRRTASRYVKKVMQDAGINGAQSCPKGLRHSFAVHCLTSNVPITLIKKWLGHSSLATTSIYLDVANDEEKIIAKKIW